MPKRFLHLIKKTLWVILAIIVILLTIYYQAFTRLMVFGSRAFPMPAEEIRLNKVKPLQCPKKMMTVLSIDGGGSRGLIPIVLLKHMHESSHREIFQIFDVIGAISTGAIIATALTVPDKKNSNKPAYSPRHLESMYQTQVPKFFSNLPRHRIISVNGLLMPALDSNIKNDFFKRRYGNASINDLLTKVVLFTYDVKAQKLRAICNLPRCQSKLNNYYLHALVAAATNVVIFFPPMSFYNRDSSLEYIINDPAVIVNNPSFFTLNEAKKTCPNTKQILFLSLGTGDYTDFSQIDGITFWGASKWAAPLLNSTINTNSALIDYSLRNAMLSQFQNMPDNTLPSLIYIRINPKVPYELSSSFVDKPSELEELKSIANKAYQSHSTLLNCVASANAQGNISPICQQVFLKYIKNEAFKNQHHKLPDFLYLK